jgi:hypothetical protein
MSLDDFRNIATIIGVLFAVFTFFKGIIDKVLKKEQSILIL